MKLAPPNVLGLQVINGVLHQGTAADQQNANVAFWKALSLSIQSRFASPNDVMNQFRQLNTIFSAMTLNNIPAGELFPAVSVTGFWQWVNQQINSLSDLYASGGSIQNAIQQISGHISGPCPECGQHHD